MHPQQHQLHRVYPKHCPSMYLVSNPVRTFLADDCFLYMRFNFSADVKTLQEDLDNLQQWEKGWQMKFNPDKCEVLRINSKQKVVDSGYTIRCRILLRTDTVKYWQTLSRNLHKDIVTKKTFNTTAFLRQNLSSCPPGARPNCSKHR